MKKLFGSLLILLMLMPATQLVAQNHKLHKPIKIEKKWKDYDPGTVVFKDKNEETEGSKIYHQIVPDPDTYIRENALRVLQTLYYGPKDPNVPRIKNIYYNLEKYDGVSEKSGQGDQVAIRYSTNWVERVQREAAAEADAPSLLGIKGGYNVDYETRGVIYHELTHAYQLNPRGAGRYDGKSECWSFIEGLADGVRVACGCFSPDFKSTDRPRRGNWRTGYRVSGYFLFWLQQHKDKDFLRKFNASAAELDRWSWDAACRHILGEGVADLWKQYKKSIGEELQPGELMEPESPQQYQARYSKRVSILGDSYSTFEEYTVPDTNAIWYFSTTPQQGNDVRKVEETWWHQFISKKGYRLEQNNSYSGSTICNTGYRKEDYTHESFITRMRNLGSPDIILIFGGTNDSWARSPIGEFKYADWTKADLYSFRPAMAKMLDYVKKRYIGVSIYFILNSELSEEVTNSSKEICEHYGVPCIELHDIDKQRGHPSVKGMKQIAEQLEHAIR